MNKLKTVDRIFNEGFCDRDEARHQSLDNLIYTVNDLIDIINDLQNEIKYLKDKLNVNE